MIEFRQKKFSFLDDTLTGGVLGANVAGIGSIFREKNIGYKDKHDGKLGEEPYKKALMMSAGGFIIGAALGAMVSGIKKLSKSIGNKRTVNNRLMNDVIMFLKNDNLKEGTDFTRDPKISNNLKTKVSIVITKYSGDLRIAINTANDIKLKRITDEIVKRIPNTSAVTQNLTDKFNDIMITSISDSSADAGLITGIAEKFIHSGYPVYLVEVG